MSGNVVEWCFDDWHDNYEGAPEDGRAWLFDNNNHCQMKSLRGGGWYNDPWGCRSADRGWGHPDGIGEVGFRVVCVGA